LEFTVSETNTDKFAEAICAFSNDLSGRKKPGFVLIGVDDQGVVQGVKDIDNAQRTVADIRSNGNILPQPRMIVTPVQSGGKTFIAVQVEPGDTPPYRYKGRTFVRVGPRRAFATAAEERALHERSVAGSRTWDLRSCRDASLEDIALDLFKLGYLPSAVNGAVLAENGRTPQEQMASLRFFDLRQGLPTNAGVLLFGKDPLYFFPGAYIQYVRYTGLDQAATVQLDRRLEGDLSTVMRELDRLIDTVCDARPVRQADLSDRTVFAYPRLALHELCMNAVIHRNYEDSSSPVSISHYEDRIEILNPGGLYGDLSMDMFPHGQAYRNPVIAEAAKTLGFVNRFGRGIAIAQADLERNGSPPVELRPTGNFFLAIVKQRP